MKTRDKIKQAVLQAAREQKISDITVKEIAKKAGITEGAIYKHFKGKNELLVMLYKEGLNSLETHIVLAFSREVTPQNKVLAAIEEYFSFYKKHKNLCHYLIVNEHAFWENKLLVGVKTPVDLLQEVLQENIPQYYELVGSAIMGVISQVSRSDIYGRIKLTTKSIAVVKELCASICERAQQL